MKKSILQKMGHQLKAVVFPLIAIFAALLVGSLVILLSSHSSPRAAYKALFTGAFGSPRAWEDSILKAIPFVFTALSYAIANRCGIINLGAEGQFEMGALAATIAAVTCPSLPAILHLPLTLIAGFLGGAVFGLIPAILRVQFGASELITTIMLNYIASQLISYSVNGPIMDSASSSYPQSAHMPESASLTAIFPGSRIHWGLIILLACVIFYYVFLWKTTRGYELRVVGLNSTAGEYAGMNIRRSVLRSMLLAGGFAGLGGCIEIIAVQYRLMMTSFKVTYGFTGIAVALLGNNDPLGMLLSGLLFGGLQTGSLRMQTVTDASSSVVLVVQAVIILFIAGRLMFRIQHGRHLRHKTLNIPPKAMEERGAER